MIKFRTMVDARRPDGQFLPGEQRLPRFGRWLCGPASGAAGSVDVLKGEMSLVGPRPLLLHYLPLYSPEQARRHELRPGITASAQNNGRKVTSWDEKFALSSGISTIRAELWI